MTDYIRRRLHKYNYGDRMDARFQEHISQIDPAIRHRSIRTTRFEGVGDWILKTVEFREWRRGEGGVDKAVLFCSGNPGVGKTYLSSLVIDSLHDRRKEEVSAIAWLYCDHKSVPPQTGFTVLGAIFKQLISREGMKSVLKESRGGGLMDRVMQMLRTTIASLDQVFICIDGLDEFPQENLPLLLRRLGDIVRDSPRTRIFLTGRPHVQGIVRGQFVGAVAILIYPNLRDIRNYVGMRLERDDKPGVMDNDLRADIGEMIMEKMSDSFLLVSLSVDDILRKATIPSRRVKLEELARGDGLGTAYMETLARLKAQKGNELVLGLKALVWVVYSERPLRGEELCHALGVETGSTGLASENVPTMQKLLASCLGLLTVEESSSTVRLVHFTLKAHLSSDPTRHHFSHSNIAEVCLTYLNFGSVRDLLPALDSAPSTMPLLEYASVYWGEHAKRGITENVKILALRLLNRFDKHISAQLLLLCNHRYTGWSSLISQVAGGPIGFTGLHGVAFFGITEMISPVLEMRKWDVNASDCTGNTPLIWAARRGHEEIVDDLLERRGVNPNHADSVYGRTPLSWAAEYGCEQIAMTLLARDDVNPNQADIKYGRTPLSWAAESGREGIVMMLLAREGADPNNADSEYGRTPLTWAAMNGHEGVVKILLERENVDPNQIDTEHGRTPLSWAAVGGHEGVVKMLLEPENVDPNQIDKHGRAPLSWAAMGGHEGVVKMLLERADVLPDYADTEYCRPPLMWAIMAGREAVVKILLEREDVNPDYAHPKCGVTPLLLAAVSGHGGIVKVLLEREDVNPDRADIEYGQTPLSRAAAWGHEGIVKMLLEREDVNPSRADSKDGRTPLAWAVRNGHGGVVKILLERIDVGLDEVARIRTMVFSEKANHSC